MLLFDIFFLDLYNFFTKKLRRSKDNAKASSLGFLILYFVWCIDVIAYIIGLIKPNKVSWLFIEKDFTSAIITGIISFIFFRTRYYKIYDVEDLDQKITFMLRKQRERFKYFTYLILILVPIFGFIFYRLYKFGYI